MTYYWPPIPLEDGTIPKIETRDFAFISNAALELAETSWERGDHEHLGLCLATLRDIVNLMAEQNGCFQETDS